MSSARLRAIVSISVAAILLIAAIALIINGTVDKKAESGIDQNEFTPSPDSSIPPIMNGGNGDAAVETGMSTVDIWYSPVKPIQRRNPLPFSVQIPDSTGLPFQADPALPARP